MPFRHLPNSDAQRLAALDAAYKKWGTTAAGDRLITAAHFASLDLSNPNSLYSTFKKDVGESAAALAKQSTATGGVDRAYSALAQFVSHFIQTFNLAVARGVFPRSDRAYYGLDVSHSDVPPLVTQADITGWAQKVIDGEAARLADNPGATPMELPSAGEVAAALAALSPVDSAQSKAKDTYQKEQEDVATDRGPVDALITDVWDTIEFNLRTLDGPSRRRRAREWGVIYLLRADEPPDPAPAPPPPPTGETGPSSGERAAG